MNGISRRRAALGAIALVLACACAVGGLLVGREHDEPGERTRAERYGEVLRVATVTADAMVNIDHRHVRESIDKVAETVTPEFLARYVTATDGIVDGVRRFRSVLVGRAEVAAVASLDARQAKVLVATTGKVNNQETGAQPRARNYRMLFTLVRTDDGWRAADLELVH